MNWPEFVGELAGAALVYFALLRRLRLKERQREARKERPPQTAKLLRPAGYSAMCRSEKLKDELMNALILTIATGVLFGITLCPVLLALVRAVLSSGQILPALIGGGILSLVVIALGAVLRRSIAKISKIHEELRDWQFGAKGEQAVAEELVGPGMAGAGYVTFNDVPGFGESNIDHVVVGSGGVFVLETKARARRKATKPQDENVVFFDGQVLEFPWCYENGAGQQVERNAGFVREFLAAFPPKNIRIQPVIVVPGWYVTSRGNYPVKAMNAKYLVGYLRGEKPLYTPEELEPVIKRLDERCRTVEF